jgi:hypothetical protein
MGRSLEIATDPGRQRTPTVAMNANGMQGPGVRAIGVRCGAGSGRVQRRLSPAQTVRPLCVCGLIDPSEPGINV